MHKRDPLRGLNPDQSGPIEKIQNGDPRSAPNRDQRSGCKESGGQGPSLQMGPTGTLEGQVPPHEGLIIRPRHQVFDMPEGISGETLPAGSYDLAGDGEFSGGKGSVRKNIFGKAQGPQRLDLESGDVAARPLITDPMNGTHVDREAQDRGEMGEGQVMRRETVGDHRVETEGLHHDTGGGVEKVPVHNEGQKVDLAKGDEPKPVVHAPEPKAPAPAA